ncbi:MAG: hypothetical protein WC901_06350 [Candidatus Margulisiibacteriota bacterium]
MIKLNNFAKIIVLVCTAILLLVAMSTSGPATGKPSKNHPFKLNLILIKEEFGEESSIDTYYVSIVNQNVKYAWKHTGYPADQEKHHNYKLTPPGLHNIKQYIINEQINQNLSETRPENLPGVAVRLNLTLVLNSKSTKVRVSGMYHQLNLPEENQSNIENLKYFRKVQKILATVIRKQENF